jgi:hypothetical protein
MLHTTAWSQQYIFKAEAHLLRVQSLFAHGGVRGEGIHDRVHNSVATRSGAGKASVNATIGSIKSTTEM